MTKVLTWNDLTFWNSPEWEAIQKTLKTEWYDVRPSSHDLFAPFILTPLDKVRVVILGEEPSTVYPVDGLTYSYPRMFGSGMSAACPAALETIFEEYQTDLGFERPSGGSLRPWARQGVLLLNQTLSTRSGLPGSHRRLGWTKLVEEVILTLYGHNPNTIFMFWTADAAKWDQILPKDANILRSGCPRPGLAYSGFHKSQPFTRVNEILDLLRLDPIDWKLP
jgi:uracil-DNA glycosylase